MNRTSMIFVIGCANKGCILSFFRLGSICAMEAAVFVVRLATDFLAASMPRPKRIFARFGLLSNFRMSRC